MIFDLLWFQNLNWDRGTAYQCQFNKGNLWELNDQIQLLLFEYLEKEGWMFLLLSFSFVYLLILIFFFLPMQHEGLFDSHQNSFHSCSFACIEMTCCFSFQNSTNIVFCSSPPSSFPISFYLALCFLQSAHFQFALYWKLDSCIMHSIPLFFYKSFSIYLDESGAFKFKEYCLICWILEFY
jgi:hypothetical protein